MPSRENLVERLSELYGIERDATVALDKAQGRLASLDCREQLQRFQEDHRRHLDELHEALQALGGPGEERLALRGIVLRVLTNLRSLVGDEMTLEAVKRDEQVIKRRLQDALEELALSDDLRDLLRRHLAKEREHVEWLKRAIEDHLWEPRVPV